MRAIDFLRQQADYHRKTAESYERTIKALDGDTGNRSDGKPKRRFSAAARRRMSAGMRAFWKKRKAAQ